MINFNTQNTPKPELAPALRIRSFAEISTGYTEDMAVREAMRCLRCKNPRCMSGCPLHNRIPEFLAKIAEGDFEAAYTILRDRSPMPEICSRVCPQESQCEGHCIRGVRGKPVSIGLLERFVCDRHQALHSAPEPAQNASNGHKVAVIGAGPAGMACAGALADKGYDVCLMDGGRIPGGIMRYGIPAYRLPKDLLADKLDVLQQKGVRFVSGVRLDEEKTVDMLLKKEGYEAVFLGTGADQPSGISIPGAEAEGVCTAHAFLSQLNQRQQGLPIFGEQIPMGKKVAVIGAGNVAMDAARCALRLGAESVQIIYRRGMEQISARRDELQEAQEEGAELLLFTQPVEIKTDKDGHVCGMVCERLSLGESDESGRCQPVSVPESSFTLETDMVILALGSRQSPVLASIAKDLTLTRRGGIAADENGVTSRPDIFAGGDAVTGPANVSKAISAGLRAAESIDAYLSHRG